MSDSAGPGAGHAVDECPEQLDTVSREQGPCRVGAGQDGAGRARRVGRLDRCVEPSRVDPVGPGEHVGRLRPRRQRLVC